MEAVANNNNRIGEAIYLYAEQQASVTRIMQAPKASRK